ncbi:RAD52 DNA repair protein [Mycena filopes]|nr:RAD52 DNA repair protein [Mycena filopes]
MAGALSGHIIDSFESSVSNQSICTDGLISFNPNMHGSFNPNMHSTQQSFSFANPSPASTSTSESAYDRVNLLQTKLNQRLGPEFISQRPGPGGGPKLTYAEGWKVINIANEVFGFEGWSSNIVSLTTDYMDYNEETRRYNVGVSAVMRVTLKEGVCHEDVGYGMIENAKSKGMALDKCKKEAVTDGLKRTLRTFGNVLGNCLYDKQYTAEIVKMKTQPTKFDKSQLYRLPEFSDKPPAAVSTSSASTSRASITATSTPVRAPAPAAAPQQRWQPQAQAQAQQQFAKPISSVPRHMQPKTTSGLQTPITTPAPERKAVSFAPQAQPQAQMQIPRAPAGAEDGGDESFGFFSDDDAFLACVDMGEGDLGRPIEYEEGAGSSVVSGGDEGETSVSPPQQQEGVKQEDRYGPMGLGRTGTGTGQGAMNPPPNPPQQQRQVVPRAQQKPASSASTSRAAAILNATRGVTANQNQKPLSNPSALPSAPAGGGAAETSAPAPAPAPAKRPPTPSVGGFHFPPGMAVRRPFFPAHSDPDSYPRCGRDDVRLPPLPLDICGSLTSPCRRGGTSAGLGLSGIGAARQPLGTLALDPQQQQDGSDPKRVRR